MKKIELQCVDCGLKRFSFGRNERCNPCATIKKYNAGRQQIIKDLENLGAVNVVLDEINSLGKSTISFTHPVCGTTQTWQASNITKVLKADPNTAPCSSCGSKRRTVKATAASAKARGIPEHLLSEWEIYRKKVRVLSEQTYRLFKSEINPLDLPRGVLTNHLDHKFPIVEGFLQGIDPEILAHKSNLQMLPSTENISKGSKLSS